MKLELALGLSLSAAIVAALELGPERSAFSSGPLSRAHAEVLCSDCHVPFRGVAGGRKCARCHEAQATERLDAFAGSRCVDCHREHRGDGALSEVPEGACQPCHEPFVVPARSTRPSACRLGFHSYHRNDRSPTPLAQSPGGALAAEPSPVASAEVRAPCGENESCVRCHSTSQAEHAKRTGKRGGDDCVRCHREAHHGSRR